VDTPTIQHCWWKAAILPAVEPPVPIEPSVPISLLLWSLLNVNVNDNHNQADDRSIRNVEKWVGNLLNDLVSTRALQSSNKMDIEVLLNPADELHVMDEVTDEVGMKKISSDGCIKFTGRWTNQWWG